MLRKFSSHLRNQWMGALALFLVLGGGTAYAVTQIDRNSVKSKHIVNGEVQTADVADDGLTGADIEEGTLGQVPSAAASDAAQDANTLDGKDASQFALTGSEGWRNLLTGSTGFFCDYRDYGNGFNPASYFRDRAGVVHLMGMVKAMDGDTEPCGDFDSDSVINPFGELPAGYRPANRELFTITANNKPARIDVTTEGELKLATPTYPTWADAKAWFSLDGISFRCGPSGQDGCP